MKQEMVNIPQEGVWQDTLKKNEILCSNSHERSLSSAARTGRDTCSRKVELKRLLV
jgi:hypothetical protein